MPGSHLDHIVVVAPTLEAGVEFVRASLGVTPQTGGEHPRMGTHNRLLSLGPDAYLEVIASNPGAPAPDRPRWFGLDERAPDAPPRLAAWVVRTPDIRATLAHCTEPLGEVEPMSRADLNWLITIPADGRLQLGGIAPALIEWKVSPPPSARLNDAGCALLKLELFHPEAERVSALVKSLAFEGHVSVCPISQGEKPYMVAHVRTPDGVARIGGPE